MKHLYEQVYADIKKDIISGKYKTGDRIPSEKELANSFNVSTITIRKALELLVNEGFLLRKRGIGTIVKSTAIKKNDPVTNNASESKSDKKPLFGLIFTNFDGSFGNTLLFNIVDTSANKCNFILKLTDGSPEKESKFIKELLDYGIDGLIMLPAHSENYSFEILKMVVNRFPLVLVDRIFKGLAVSSIGTDNVQAAQLGVNHLFDLGHEHICVLFPEKESVTTIEDRLMGIVKGFSDRKKTVEMDLWISNIKCDFFDNNSIAKYVELIKNHIKKNPKITAFFALEYNMALLAKKAVEELGLRIPEDISILCFDSPTFNKMENYFSHIKQNEVDMGRTAVDLLLKLYKGTSDIQNIRIPAKIVKGKTTTWNPHLKKILI